MDTHVEQDSGQPRQYRALINSVRDESGLKVGRAYKRWFMANGVWEDLVLDTGDAVRRLEEALAVELSKPSIILRRRRAATDSQREAKILVAVTLATLVQSLSPSRAIAVSADRIRREVSSVRHLIESHNTLEEELRKLPPLARANVRELYARDATQAVGLIDLYTSADNPADAFKDLITSPPDWLRPTDGRAWLFIAETLYSFNCEAEAAAIFEKIAKEGWDRSRCLVRSALCYAALDDRDRATRLLDRATEFAPEPSCPVDLARALVAEDSDRALSIASDPLNFDVMIAGFLLNATVQSKGIPAAIEASRGFVLKHPEYSGFRMTLVRLTLENVRQNGVALSTKEKQDLLAVAVEARDLRREWRGPSGGAVILACEVALTQGDLSFVLKVGTIAPKGEALPAEVSAPELKRLVAEAAIYSGDNELTQCLLAEIIEPFDRKFLLATQLLVNGAENAAVLRTFGEAWALCRSEADRLAVWHHVAALGGELPEREALEARGDVVGALILSQYAAATGDVSHAIGILRPHKNKSPFVVELLARLYLKVDDAEAAAEVLVAAASHFDHPLFLSEMAVIWAQRGQLDKAEELAVRALVSLTCDTQARATMHEILIAAAERRGTWSEMEMRARALLAEEVESSNGRWWLVGALYNQRQFDEAWNQISRVPALEPKAQMQASVWVDLNVRYRRDPGLAEQIFALMDRFPDADFIGACLGRYMRWSVSIALPSGTAEDGRRRIESFIEAHPGHSALSSISMSDETTPDELVERFRPMLEPQARALRDLTRQVASAQIPYGLLAAFAGKPYAMVYAHRAAGCLPIESAEGAVVRLERAAAIESLQGEVVVDTSTLATFFFIQSMWPNVHRKFRRIVIPAPTKSDIVVAVDVAEMPSDGNIGWDVDNETIRVTEVDPTAQERLRLHTRWMKNVADEVESVDWSTIRNMQDIFEDGSDSRFLPWLAAIDYALESNVPLFADDCVVRSIARHLGVRTFGTVSFLYALVHDGSITSDELAIALEELRFERCVDLPLDALAISHVAEKENWAPGAAAYIFSRQASWGDPIAFKMWCVLARKAYSAAADNLPGWLYCAVSGFTEGKQPSQMAVQGAALACMATLISGGDSAMFCRLLSSARAALEGRGAPDVLAVLVGKLREFFDGMHGPQVAGAVVLSITCELDDHDRQVAREVIFG